MKSSFHFISDYYAQPGIHGSDDCHRHCMMETRSRIYIHHTCFCNLCEEDIKKLTPRFLDRFLTAGGCNSLQDLNKGVIEMFQETYVTYYYCRHVKPILSPQDAYE